MEFIELNEQTIIGVARGMSALICFVGIIAWARWARHHPGWLPYAVPPLLWLTNAAAFYVFSFLGRNFTDLGTYLIVARLWPVALGIQAAATLSTIGVILALEKRGLSQANRGGHP